MREVIASVVHGGRTAVSISGGLLALALGCLAASLPASAQELAGGALVAGEPWSRATPAGSKVGVGYLVLQNRSSSPQRFVAARSDVAGKTELHETVESGGVARMSPLPILVVPAGGSIEFAPGGRHVMFMDLKRPLRQGERFVATLVFEPAGAVTVEFEVRGMGAGAGPHHAH
jgi:copper(I)-binding protein